MGRAVTMHRAGSGEPVVLLHGLGLTWRCWKPVLRGLEALHDAIALDLPGFGDAPPLEDRAPTVAALADAVEAELDRLGIEAAHLGGNSLGGWIALELARRGRARSVVALAPSGLELPPERAYVISLNEAMRARARAAAPVAGVLAANPVTRTSLLGPMRARPWRVAAEDAAAEVRAFARAPGFQPTVRWTLAAQPALGLGDIAVPVRVCTGTRDAMLGTFTAPRFAASIRGAELHRLPGCGHVPMADDPAAIAACIVGLTAG
jgi:pimeloyl-ACP methyl ester carboxylesterase